MSVIRFDYTPEVFINPKTQKVDYVYRPLIDIRLCYKHNFGKNLVGCLLDSGADKNLFPASWGESVNIEIKKGELVHGWKGYPEEGWRPWLKNELEKRGFKVFVPAMPDTANPTMDKWVPYLKKIVAGNGEIKSACCY